MFPGSGIPKSGNEEVSMPECITSHHQKSKYKCYHRTRKSTNNYDDNNIQEETQQIHTTTDRFPTSVTSRKFNQYYANLRKNLKQTDNILRESPNSLQQRDTVSNFEQSARIAPLPTPTQARSLSDIYVSGKIIDECFHMCV
jgi:hypothetical protein